MQHKSPALQSRAIEVFIFKILKFSILKISHFTLYYCTNLSNLKATLGTESLFCASKSHLSHHANLSILHIHIPSRSKHVSSQTNEHQSTSATPS